MGFQVARVFRPDRRYGGKWIITCRNGRSGRWRASGGSLTTNLISRHRAREGLALRGRVSNAQEEKEEEEDEKKEEEEEE